MEHLTLYHYTSEESAESIIKTRELWLTDANSLDDGKEIRARFSIFKEQVKASESFLQLSIKNQQKFSEYIIDHLVEDEYFLACFCATERNPYLWEHYAHNNTGRCLAFNLPLPDGEKRLFPLQIVPMQYKDVGSCSDLQAQLNRLVYPDLTELDDSVKRLRNKGVRKKRALKVLQKSLHGQQGYLECRNAIARSYVDFCLRTKSEKHKLEHEWRLVASRHLETWFDPSRIFYHKQKQKRFMRFPMPEGFLLGIDYKISQN